MVPMMLIIAENELQGMDPIATQTILKVRGL